MNCYFQWSAPGGANFKNTKPLPYKTGAVIGAGTMGTGISMAMLNAGIPVTLVEQDKKVYDKTYHLLKTFMLVKIKYLFSVFGFLVSF